MTDGFPPPAALRAATSPPSGRGERKLGPRAERPLDLRLKHGIDIFRRHRADQFVQNRAVAPDDKSFGHAIDAPFDRGAAIAVDADDAERVAVAAEEAPRVVGCVLVVDADQLQPLVLAELRQQRRFVVAGHAPGGPDIDQADLALEQIGVEAGYRTAIGEETVQRRQRGLWYRPADQG